MKTLLYLISVSLIVSCLASKSSINSKTESNQDSVTQQEFFTKKKIDYEGDTTLIITNFDCLFVVEDISNLFSFPDSFPDAEVSQSYPIGDTLRNEKELFLEVFIQTKNRFDTLHYKVNLRCLSREIPQFISPNGHGHGSSDTWELPFLLDYPNNTVKIFNRWGNLVFEEKRYYTGWWGTTNISDSTDKQQNTKLLPEGTYYYIIDLGDSINDPYVGYLYIRR